MAIANALGRSQNKKKKKLKVFKMNQSLTFLKNDNKMRR